MMKVTYLTGEYPPMQGGIADHTAYLAAHLQPLEVTASVLISRRWHQAGPPPPDGPLTVHAEVPDWGWRCWPAVTAFLARHRPDVLHVQYQAAAFDLGGWVNWLPWYLKKRKLATRLVTTFHDLRLPYVFPRAGSFRWKSILALARHSHAVICTNREDLVTLQSDLDSPAPLLPRSRAKPPFGTAPLLHLIPLGSNVEPQPPAGFNRVAWRQQYWLDDSSLLLAYFGFLNESKGGEELIEALAQLRRQGLDARLLLIGGDIGHADPTNLTYAQRVRGLISRYGLENFVYATGYTDLARVSANLLAADVVVMPYRDGVSFRRTTLIAALRHGCPVVSTMPANPGLLPEIRPGENMLLAPPCQPDELARLIARLAGDPALYQKLAAGSRQLGQLFEWPEIARKTSELYRAVMEG